MAHESFYCDYLLELPIKHICALLYKDFTPNQIILFYIKMKSSMCFIPQRFCVSNVVHMLDHL